MVGLSVYSNDLMGLRDVNIESEEPVKRQRSTSNGARFSYSFTL